METSAAFENWRNGTYLPLFGEPLTDEQIKKYNGTTTEDGAQVPPDKKVRKLLDPRFIRLKPCKLARDGKQCVPLKNKDPKLHDKENCTHRLLTNTKSTKRVLTCVRKRHDLHEEDSAPVESPDAASPDELPEEAGDDREEPERAPVILVPAAPREAPPTSPSLEDSIDSPQTTVLDESSEELPETVLELYPKLARALGSAPPRDEDAKKRKRKEILAEKVERKKNTLAEQQKRREKRAERREKRAERKKKKQEKNKEKHAASSKASGAAGSERKDRAGQSSEQPPKLAEAASASTARKEERFSKTSVEEQKPANSATGSLSTGGSRLHRALNRLGPEDAEAVGARRALQKPSGGEKASSSAGPRPAESLEIQQAAPPAVKRRLPWEKQGDGAVPAAGPAQARRRLEAAGPPPLFSTSTREPPAASRAQAEGTQFRGEGSRREQAIEAPRAPAAPGAPRIRSPATPGKARSPAAPEAPKEILPVAPGELKIRSPAVPGASKASSSAAPEAPKASSPAAPEAPNTGERAARQKKKQPSLASLLLTRADSEDES